MKRIFTEERKVGNEHSENKNNINNSNLTQYSDKKKILLKEYFQISINLMKILLFLTQKIIVEIGIILLKI